MVFILFVSLIAGISINLSILVELFEDEVELIQVKDGILIQGGFQFRT